MNQMSTESERYAADVDMARWDELNQEEMQQLVEEVQDVARGIDATNVAIQNAEKHLRAAADYLDQVWKDCRIASAVGTSAGITGGVLSVLGGVATVMTVGAAIPLLIAGTAIGVAGAATNVGTVAVEAIVNSTVIREADRAVEDANRTIQTVNKLILGLRKGKSLPQLVFLGKVIARLDKNQLVLSYLTSCSDLLTTVPSSVVSALKAGIEAASEAAERIVAKGGSKAIAKAGTEAASKATGSAVAKGGTKAIAKAGTEAASEAAGSMVAKGGSKAIAKAGTEAASEAAESAVTKGGSTAVGKAGAQGGAKAAGGFIVGVSVAFLIVDVVDLAFTVRDIVKNKGSNAARSLRAKADAYEAMLNHQKGK